MERREELTPALGADEVYGDALRLYRLLFRRSVLTAAIVFAFLAAVNVANDFPSGASSFGLRTLGFVLSLAAPVVVQGALVEIVRNVHEGRAASRAPATRTARGSPAQRSTSERAPAGSC